MHRCTCSNYQDKHSQGHGIKHRPFFNLCIKIVTTLLSISPSSSNVYNRIFSRPASIVFLICCTKPHPRENNSVNTSCFINRNIYTLIIRNLVVSICDKPTTEDKMVSIACWMSAFLCPLERNWGKFKDFSMLYKISSSINFFLIWDFDWALVQPFKLHMCFPC